jgi:biotin carboxylase
VTTVLVLGAGGSAAANVIDALRRADHHYRTVGADASPVKLHLSAADERIVVPRADDPGYVEAIRCVVERYACDIVHPQPDPDVIAIGAARDEIGARTYMPPQDVLLLAGDKSRFADQMRSAGVTVPTTANYDTLSSVIEVTDALLTEHERVWVRARTGAGGRASLPVRSGRQADAWIRWWIEEKGMRATDFMASEMLPGREFAYQSVWENGELVAGQARQRVEYLYGHLTPSGQTSTPSVARTVDEPAVDDLAIRSIRALDPNPCGAYCVDIKESASGVANVTEINAGRFFTTSNFFAAAGLNMPDMLMRCALGEQPTPRGSSPLPADLYWIRMVDMGFVLVPGAELETFPRFDGAQVDGSA